MAQRAVRVADEQPELIAAELDIIKEVEDNPVVALTDQAKFDAYYAAIEAQALAVPIDLDTSTGRDRIKSAAAQVARKKTAIDNAGKSATEDWRKLTNAVNSARNVVKERLDDLRDRVRKPVTEWEQKEEERRTEADLIITNLRNAAIVQAHETSDDIQARLDRVRGHNLNAELFGPRIELVTDMRDDTIKALTEALERVRQAEKEREELAQLRREREERDERERQDKAEQQAREVEEARKAAEDARIKLEREEAAQRAKAAADRAHQAEQDRIAQEKQAEIDAANERARKAEELRKNEAYARSIIQHIKDCAMGFIGGQPQSLGLLHRELHTKIVIDDSFGDLRAEAERELGAAITKIEAAIQKEIDDKVEAVRKSQQEHRTACKTAAKEALMALGVPEPKAVKVVQAVIAKDIPYMSFTF